MADDQMLSIREVCKFMGGETDPLDPSTVYRWIREKKFPRPVKIGFLSRWRKSECKAARDRMKENPR
jgi:predicted DNA-binding transcriptional regulator AlpA